MRQLFSLRFVAAVAALAGLALLVRAVVAEDDDPVDAVLEVEVVDRRVDLIEPIFALTPSDDFGFAPDGTSVGFIDLILTGDRVMRIAPGTPGEVTCEELDEVNECVVLADMLGDAVVWFAILPQAPRATVELPPIIDLEGGYALFENGWQVVYADVIERDCGNIDIPTFSDFLRRFGPDSVTVVDLELEEVTTVRCGGEVVPTTIAVVSTSPGGLGLLPDGPPSAPTSAP